MVSAVWCLEALYAYQLTQAESVSMGRVRFSRQIALVRNRVSVKAMLDRLA
jgi:hypothetical protein